LTGAAKKLGLLAAAFCVPVLLGLNVAQAYRYTALKAELQSLEAQQLEWVENNKRLITAISALESPERIEKIANEALGLKKAATEDTLRVEVGNGKGDAD
jgi:cell division protein FtsL